MADFIKGARDKYGLTISYAGVWNEKVYDAEYVKELHRALQERRLSTKVVLSLIHISCGVRRPGR